MAALLSDADVGFGAAPKLLSDADVGFKPATAAATAPSPATDNYNFDVPGAQPQISDAVAPTPPEALQEARNHVPPPITDIPARVGRALIEGWKSAPDILTPQAQDWLANAERNNPRPNLQDALTVGHAALAAGNAMFRGGLEGIAALGDVAGVPQLGRDVAGYYEAMGMTGAPHVGAVLRSTLPETRAYLTEQMLADQRTKSTAAAVTNIMGANSIDGAITAATQAAQAPDPASLYRSAPAAIPPNVPAPVLPRIMDLINEDNRVAANRPEFVPPNEPQPPIQLEWGKLSAGNGGEAAPVRPETLPALVEPPANTAIDVARPPAVPTVARTAEDAKAIAHAWYQRADQAGGELPPEFTDTLINDAEKLAPQTDVGRAVAGDTEITKLVDRLQAIRGEPISLQAAQEIYEYLGDAISGQYGLKGLSKDGYNLLNLQSKFWNMIQEAGPNDIAGGPEGFQAWEQGRNAWAQAMKMIDVERIINRAEQTDNPATAIKSGVRVLLNSNRIRGYDPEEIQAIKDAGNRGVMGAVLHVFGSRLIPYAAGAAGYSGGPIGAVLGAGIGYAGSTAMRAGATALQTGRANNALSIIGGKVPPAPTPLAQ